MSHPLPAARTTAAADGRAAPRQPTPGTGLTHRQVLIIFAGLILVILISALDRTVVSTALPTIAGDLHGLNDLSWVITSYLLASTVTIPIYGKLGDLLGRKNVLVFAVVLFLVGSVLSGLSQSMLQLIVFRAVQGLGAGGIMIGAQAIIGEVVSARDRGRYMSVMMPMIGVASIAGPLLGGFLTEHASWRWIFYINIPIGAVALTVIGVGLKLPVRQRAKPVIDYWGTVLLAAGVSCIVLFTSLGGTTYGWSSAPILVLVVAAVALLGAWVGVERRAREPVLPLGLFRNRVFLVSTGLGFAVGFAMIGAISYLPTFLQLVGGSSATGSGLLLLPMVIGLMVAAVATGQLISRTGRYKIFPILGAGTAAVGLFLLSTMGVHTTTVQSSAYMVVLGIGLGLTMPVLTLVVQNSVRYERLGVATSGVTFFRQIGGTIGVALAGTLFATGLTHQLAQRLPAGTATTAGVDASSITPAALAHLPAALRADYVAAFAHALPPIFLYFTPLLVAAFVLAWFLPEHPLSTHTHADDSSTPAGTDPPVPPAQHVTVGPATAAVAARAAARSPGGSRPPVADHASRHPPT